MQQLPSRLRVTLTILLIVVPILTATGPCWGAEASPDPLAPYNVVWDSPSANSMGSMPIGNGDIGLNVWVEPSGDLVFFIGKTDSWDENVRLLKLGKIRVKLTPSLATTDGFRQELNLREGVVEIHSRQAKIRVWVDANHPVIRVNITSLIHQPLEASASFEDWRTTKRSLGPPRGVDAAEYFATGYTSLPAISYPDTILKATPQRIGWYHRDVQSPWLASLKLQKIEAIAKSETDPILNRTMGAILSGENFVSVSDTQLKTAKPARDIALHIDVLTQITDTPEQWLGALEKQADSVAQIPAAHSWEEHEQWWDAFWNRSWIFANGSGSPVIIPISAQPWRVGVDSDGGSKFGGAISDPLVSGAVMSADEIARLATRPKTGSAVLIGADSNLAKGCTITAWLKPAAGERGRIIDKCTAGTGDGILLDAYPGLSLRWIVGGQTLQADNCLTPNEWQHVVATVDASSGALHIYRNGKLLKASDDPEIDQGQTMTRGYVLQRFMNACSGRGAFPIKFNGSIFVVDNICDADYRAWGGGYWLQNTRLPYWSMLEAGDFDLMRPLFDMLMKALPARQLATRNYYGHDGAFFPETMTFWGNYLDQGVFGYGTDRTGKPDGLTDNENVRRHWQGGLEMVALMLDYYDLTQDSVFRDQTLLPFARQIIAFFEQHWQRGPDGKIVMYPAQALETWWDVKNPLPEVAGLHFVLPRLLALTGDPVLQKSWKKTLADLPPVPTRTEPKTGKTVLVPGETFAKKRNIENPELYAIFPYRLYTLAAGTSPLAVADATWPLRRDPENGGWQQNGIQAALLGHADEAVRYVTDSASHHAAGFRFPAMWGPNYDWIPDQDHGSELECALQRMLLQFDGRKILVLPAWPRGLDVTFKLHVPFQTTVEGVYHKGKVESLTVTPAERRKDVISIGPSGH